MRHSMIVAGLVGLSVVMGLMSCAVLGNEDKPSVNPGPASSSSSGSGAGGAGGAGTAGGGMGGGAGAAPVCNKDGTKDDGEECDDGNMMDKDGCDMCKLETCYAWDAQAGQAIYATAGTPCDNGMFCNDAAQCGSHCVDTVQDEDEISIDCGGADCDKCIAETCAANGDCASGFCADNVCCAKKCEQTCFMCNLPGSEGTCSLIPTGIDDAAASMPCVGTGGDETKITCDTGVCIIASDNKLQNGEICIGNGDCVINLCSPVIGTGAGEKNCGLAQGQPCLLSAQCAVGMCTGGICGKPAGDPCNSNFECASAMCNTTCQ